MFVLFLVVHIFFAVGFYFLDSIILSILFLVMGICGFVFFSPLAFSLKKSWKNSEEQKKSIELIHTKKIRRSSLALFQKHILTIALILFYFAIIGILWTVSQVIEQTFVSLVIYLFIGILALSVWVQFFNILSNQVYEKLFLTNLLFVWFIGGILVIWLSDWWLLQIIFLMILIINLWFSIQSSLTKGQVFTAYLLTGIIMVASILLLHVFFKTTILGTAVLLVVFWVLSFEFAGIKQLQGTRPIIRSSALLCTYLGLTILWYGVFVGQSQWIDWISILIGIIFNVYVHTRFENYPSLIVAGCTPILLIWAIGSFPTSLLSFLFYSIFLSWVYIFASRISLKSYQYDGYIFQIFAIASLLVNIVYYFFTVGFQWVLQISCILLMLSWVLFISFLQIRKK